MRDWNWRQERDVPEPRPLRLALYLGGGKVDGTRLLDWSYVR